MDEDVADKVKEISGKNPARLFVISEKNLAHANSNRHIEHGVALSLAEYQSLPKAISKPKAVLWDYKNSNLLYIIDSEKSTYKVVINAPYNLKGSSDKLDVMINAYKLNLGRLRKAVDGGQYKIIQGNL